MAIINGTPGNDKALNGTSGDDIIDGGAGADTISAGAGNDAIYGGTGADSISAGGGDDLIAYDESDKRISGDAGTDTLWLNGTGQRLNLNNKAIQGIETLRLEGGGGHAVTLRATDVVRMSDTDTLTITGTDAGLVNTRLLIGTGWSFISADGQSQTLRNGQATLTVGLPVFIDGYSNNATINFATGADTAVNEDEGTGLPTRPLAATGRLLVDDTNAGQGLLLGTPVAVGTPLGALTLTLITTDSATAPGVYDYFYSVGNDKVQSLGAGMSMVDSFTVRTIDGTTRTLSFTINGTNDAAVIGDPATSNVTEDQDGNGDYLLKAEGSIGISDADSGQASFQTTVASAPGNLGSLALQANGTYTYQVSNASVQSLAGGQSKVEVFTIKSLDGTTKDISFTITGANDAAVIGDPIISNVIADQTVVDGNLTVTGTLSITDADSGQSSFQTTVVPAVGNLGSLALQADGSYTYQVSNASVQYLAGGATKVDIFTVKSFDGTTKDISFTITGANDAANIGLPTLSNVTEDQSGNGDYLLKAEGSISISDADSEQASFKTKVVSAAGNLGSLVLQANGSYTYQVSNASVQSLNGGAIKIETFTVESVDGTTKNISFTINGANDAAAISLPSVSNITEDQTGNGDYLLKAEGSIGITDIDNGQAWFKTNVVSAADNLGTLILQADGSYTYQVSNTSVQSLGGSATKVETFTVESVDGTKKDISFTITGANDPSVIGAPNVFIVTEDMNVNEAGQLTAVGTIDIWDPDSGELSFRTQVLSRTTNLGTLVLQENGSYVYSVDNTEVQFLGPLSQPNFVDTFTVFSTDGVQRDVSFGIAGVKEPAIIGAPDNNTVTEDENVVDGWLTATGKISITDIEGDGLFQAVLPTMSRGIFTMDIYGNYKYQISNEFTQTLAENTSAIDTFNVTASDGTSKQISFNIQGINDAPLIVDYPLSKTTADVFELADNDPNANNTNVRAVSGSFRIRDIDFGDTLSFVDASQSIKGTYGTLSFNFGGYDSGAGAQIVNWTYAYTDRSLNPLPQTDNAHELFNIGIKDSQSAVTSQTIDITLHGKAESFNTSPSAFTIVELGDTEHGEGTATRSLGGLLNAVGVTKVSIAAGLNNLPYLGDFYAVPDQSSGVITWGFNVSEVFIDYLLQNEQVTQSYVIDVQFANGTTLSKLFSFNLVGASDGREQEWTGNDADQNLVAGVLGADTKIVRALGGDDYISGLVDAGKIYGDDGNDTIQVTVRNPNFGFGVIRGGNGDDTLRVSGPDSGFPNLRDFVLVFGDVGNDTFDIVNPTGFQNYWGGPDSDTYIVYKSASSGAQVFDFDITPVSLGGDVVKISTAGLTLEDITNIKVRPSGSGNSWVLDINGYVALEFLGSNYKESDFIGHYGLL